jgi:lipopolysaccharide biosynthesis regulator YciM
MALVDEKRSERRLAYLIKLIDNGSCDPMALYGLAMEYRVAGRNEDAVATFAKLREADPSYVAMYLMCAQAYEAMGHRDQVRDWLTAGIVEAKRAGNSHAQAELETMLHSGGE